MKHSKTRYSPSQSFLSGLFLTLSVISAHCQWASTYGGAGKDYLELSSRPQMGDISWQGVTYSFGAGDADAWVLKLDSTGAVTWQKTYGGKVTNMQDPSSRQQMGGISWQGNTDSFGAGDADAWALNSTAQERLPGRKLMGVLIMIMRFQSSRQQMGDISWQDPPIPSVMVPVMSG